MYRTTHRLWSKTCELCPKLLLYLIKRVRQYRNFIRLTIRVVKMSFVCFIKIYMVVTPALFNNNKKTCKCSCSYLVYKQNDGFHSLLVRQFRCVFHLLKVIQIYGFTGKNANGTAFMKYGRCINQICLQKCKN